MVINDKIKPKHWAIAVIILIVIIVLAELLKNRFHY